MLENLDKKLSNPINSCDIRNINRSFSEIDNNNQNNQNQNINNQNINNENINNQNLGLNKNFVSNNKDRDYKTNFTSNPNSNSNQNQNPNFNSNYNQQFNSNSNIIRPNI
jgi:hypothetical protein